MEKGFSEYHKTLSAKTKTYYESIGAVYCPALKKTVVFNAKGFHHLHYKPGGTERSPSEKIHKLTLVPLAVPVIRNATSIHEERLIEIRPSRKKSTEKIKAVQYALVANVGKKKPIQVRLILLEACGSNGPIFWSIMRH
jgi:hypothetical protein